MRTELTAGMPRLAVSIAGRGPLVIFIHGLSGDRKTWHWQLEALSNSFTAVSVDLRGYGNSEAIEGELDFARDFSADLLSVMDHFGAAGAHLVGLSMGGRVARAAAVKHPSRVASVTLANTSAGFDALTPEQCEAFVRAREFQPGPLDELPAGYAEQQAISLTAPGAGAEVRAAVARTFVGLSASHYLKVMRASIHMDRGIPLESIRCPVHIVSSDLDTVYPPTMSRQMQQRIPSARLTCIEGAGHLSYLEQPLAFHEAIRSFLVEQVEHHVL